MQVEWKIYARRRVAAAFSGKVGRMQSILRYVGYSSHPIRSGGVAEQVVFQCCCCRSAIRQPERALRERAG